MTDDTTPPNALADGTLPDLLASAETCEELERLCADFAADCMRRTARHFRRLAGAVACCLTGAGLCWLIPAPYSPLGFAPQVVGWVLIYRAARMQT